MLIINIIYRLACSWLNLNIYFLRKKCVGSDLIAANGILLQFKMFESYLFGKILEFFTLINILIGKPLFYFQHIEEAIAFQEERSVFNPKKQLIQSNQHNKQSVYKLPVAQCHMKFQTIQFQL